MIKYWCGNLTSFGELSTKIVGIFPVCFKNFFYPDEAQLHLC